MSTFFDTLRHDRFWREVRGDHGGHSFHGNQHTGSKGGFSPKELAERTTVIHALYHDPNAVGGPKKTGVPKLTEGGSRWGHGGTYMSTHKTKGSFKATGPFKVFSVHDDTTGSGDIWSGRGKDKVFNRVIKEMNGGKSTAIPAGKYGIDHWRNMQSNLAAHLKKHGFDGIQVGGEVVIWNYSKISKLTRNASAAEFRGDVGGHAFHGNQHVKGMGGGGYTSMAVLGNVVVPASGPKTSKEYAAALRQAGYKGPLSYPKGKLKELYDVHVKGSTESVNIGHPTTSTSSGGGSTAGFTKVPGKSTADPLTEGHVAVTASGKVYVYDKTLGVKSAAPGHPLEGAAQGVYKAPATGLGTVAAASAPTAHPVAKKYSNPDEGTISKTGQGNVWVATKTPDGKVGWKKATPEQEAAVAGQPAGHYKLGAPSTSTGSYGYPKPTSPVGGLPKATVASVSHAGSTYDHGSSPVSAKQGSIQVKSDGTVQYKGANGWEPAGPNTTAKFKNQTPGVYQPTTNAVKSTGATVGGKAIPPQTPITTSVKKLAHEVDGVTSHDRGKSVWDDSRKAISTSGHEGIPDWKHYIGSGYSAMNKSMRSQSGPNANAKRMLKMHRDIGVKTTQPITVDRGITGSHATSLANLKAGSTVSYKSFASTTYSQHEPGGGGHHSAATGFGSGQETTIMRITLPTGTKVLRGTESEKELILAPGKFTVSHVSKVTAKNPYGYGSGTHIIIHLTYQGEDYSALGAGA